MNPTPFPQLLHAFFHDWLVQQRNVSHHTVVSYRDSWRLFLRFVAAMKKKSVAKIGLSDLTTVEALAFLEDIERVRKSSIGTRNCRLAALHSFFSFMADREPLAAAQCAAVLRIPTKQAPKREIRDLDEEEITAILAQPDRSKIEGQRDHVLLAFLFNTGGPHSGGAEPHPQGPPLGVAVPSSAVWQRAKRTYLPPVAGNGRTAEGSFETKALRRR